MNVGDIVKWVGFEGYSGPTDEYPEFGMVLRKWADGAFGERFDILWDDTTIGERLYQETIEVVYESR